MAATEIEAIATAWLDHQGYTAEAIAAAPLSHEKAGCDLEGMSWNCWNEFGESLHPVWDAVCVAGEMANVAVEALQSIGYLRTEADL